ncbi:tRNA (adenosine(37)-N6)-threonylcarbamoyltransferase complex dimerization subunit type 1 TsaB [Chitinophaga barathri]|uniref:tRNA (Adenosine(37)-N6)-threonylcarbamoyltransferase complex dimerization subunit type 1 TsaB n=1 Tax=Chitinophaga barathri TaxID=1647451 RepID=A0A3N4MJE3_9BACT|nr:tRNA (adenosine(37)-N6)-threonylcarbamoyltransferase complex dimerization subunit type 1 TsaB [Chitinophaga barathri]RPD40220.1 tRNA (adenosine(37)-N6)-threonylcarbamoyltransferase complex dimerization subunit type 1 TsaB [Chitinophaga barathri]
MALILHIDTATSFGSVCLSQDGKELETLHNADQKDHAATIGLFIQRLLNNHGIRHEELDAIAVSAGPGSYTGLRVGAATVKGLCYTWKKPLIAVSTLQMMASGLQAEHQEDAFYVPMIDARRMEVFTAVYNSSLHAEMPPQAMILAPDSFSAYMGLKTAFFFGDGAAKWRPFLGSPTNAVFPTYQISAAHMIPLADKAFASKHFQDVAYFAPHYLKAFFTPGKP